MRRQGRADDLRARRTVQGIGLVRDRLREEVVGRFEIRVEVGFRRQERFLKRLRIEGQGFRNEEGNEAEGRIGIEKLGEEMSRLPHFLQNRGQVGPPARVRLVRRRHWQKKYVCSDVVP